MGIFAFISFDTKSRYYSTVQSYYNLLYSICSNLFQIQCIVKPNNFLPRCISSIVHYYILYLLKTNPSVNSADVNCLQKNTAFMNFPFLKLKTEEDKKNMTSISLNFDRKFYLQYKHICFLLLLFKQFQSNKRKVGDYPPEIALGGGIKVLFSNVANVYKKYEISSSLHSSTAPVIFNVLKWYKHCIAKSQMLTNVFSLRLFYSTIFFIQYFLTKSNNG